MTKVQYSFAQLGESEIFEPYLSSELKKNSCSIPDANTAGCSFLCSSILGQIFRIKKRKLFSGSFSGLRDKGGTFGQLAAAGRKYSAFHQL